MEYDWCLFFIVIIVVGFLCKCFILFLILKRLFIIFCNVSVVNNEIRFSEIVFLVLILIIDELEVYIF